MNFDPLNHQISLHGLGFIQVTLPGNQRLHVWHPDLPRRKCFEHSAIHNHRFSFRSTVLVDGQCVVRAHDDRSYGPGESYEMPALAYHETPNSGVVVTLMQKLDEGTVHAHSIIRRGHEFDQSFDRFQLSDEQLWAYVVEALKGT